MHDFCDSLGAAFASVPGLFLASIVRRGETWVPHAMNDSSKEECSFLKKRTKKLLSVLGVAGLVFFSLLAIDAMTMPAAGAATRDHTGTIYDFLVMKVCTANDGSVTAQDPLHCPPSRQRNLRPNEAVPYYHADFAPLKQPGLCGDAGTNRRYAFPLDVTGSDQTGQTYPLIVGWANYPPDRKGCVFNQAGPRDTMTLLTVQGGWGAILGSRSPSGYVAALGSGYLDTATAGIARFNKTWGLPEALPQPGKIGMDILPKHTQVLGKDMTGVSSLPDHNPAAKLSRTFEFWTRLTFTYGTTDHPTASLDTLLLIGFPKSLDSLDGPGESRGSEHLYLTQELGYVTRWDDWHRDDQKNTLPRAKRAYLNRNCTRPAAIEGRVSAHFTLGPLVEDTTEKMWRQDATTIDSTGKSTTHTWYMVGCHDYTNVHAQAPFVPASAVTEQELGTPFINLFRTQHAH
jgi:hypothetical protein